MAIKISRENLIKTLTGIKEPNIQIADVAFDRRKLLQALKILNYPGTEVLTVNYGKMSFKDYDKHGDTISEVDHESCIQFNCDHQILRFLNRPVASKGKFEPEVKSLRFIDKNLDVKLEVSGLPLNPKELLSALQFVLPCVNNEGSRPVLECVLFDSSDNILKLVTADGFTLGYAELNIQGVPNDKALIHSSQILKLVTFLKAIKPQGKGRNKFMPDVYMSYQADNSIKFQTEINSVTLTRFDGTFPEYERLIPQYGTHIEFIASEMLQAVKALSSIAKDSSNIIRLQFTKPDKITLSAKQDTCDGEALSNIESQAKVEHDCKIAVNCNYLINFLSQCSDDVIDIFLTEASRPMVFHNGISRYHVVMPMFVQR